MNLELNFGIFSNLTMIINEILPEKFLKYNVPKLLPVTVCKKIVSILPFREENA